MRFFPLLMLLVWNTGSAPSWEKVGLYISVGLTSSVKFLIGLVAASAIPHFGFWDIMISAGGGALIGAWIFTLFGAQIRVWLTRWWPKKQAKPSNFAKKRRVYGFWKRYGLIGAVALAPILSPMVSIGIALAFRERPWRILIFITASIIVYTLLFASFKDEINVLLHGM